MAKRLTPEARRAAIIEVAQTVIAEEGYRALSLREVARRCGMSAPGLMHHFPDMESLLEAVLAHRDETDIAAISGGDFATIPLDEMIRRAGLYYAANLDQTRSFDALEAEALDPKHPAHEWFTRRNERTMDALRPRIEREFDEPERAFRLLSYLLDGMRLNWLRHPERIGEDEDWTTIRDLLDVLPRKADPSASA